MYVDFSELVVGAEYESPELAQHWGYKSMHAISRGVITPVGTNIIILFVTREKQASLTQYEDHLDGGRLHWEGEEKHGSDDRIIAAAGRGDSIHLFYREVHHSPFAYYGVIDLESHRRQLDKPSEFVFRIRSEPTGRRARTEGDMDG
jgi:putative restriction endonuclease